MSQFYGSRQAAKILGIQVHRLQQAVWRGRLPEPARAPSGAFLWSDEDIRNASLTILKKEWDGQISE